MIRHAIVKSQVFQKLSERPMAAMTVVQNDGRGDLRPEAVTLSDLTFRWRLWWHSGDDVKKAEGLMRQVAATGGS